jgi:hypothetical protein
VPRVNANARTRDVTMTDWVDVSVTRLPRIQRPVRRWRFSVHMDFLVSERLKLLSDAVQYGCPRAGRYQLVP